MGIVYNIPTLSSSSSSSSSSLSTAIVIEAILRSQHVTVVSEAVKLVLQQPVGVAGEEEILEDVQRKGAGVSLRG